MIRQVAVLSIPDDHVYVRHLEHPDHPVRRFGGPRSVHGQAPAQSTWWPPAAYQPEWLRAHADEFDVVHVQFGFDAVDTAGLRRFVACLDELGKPLVYTVHDLRNPHHLDPRPHDEALDVLVPAAAHLVTLTPGAASEIRRRWGREAQVLPHPHVVDPRAARRARLLADRVRRAREQDFVVGVHLKSLRANMAVEPVLAGLVSARRVIDGMVVQVTVHDEVMVDHGPAADPEVASLLRDLAARGEIDLRIRRFMTDDQLWRYLALLDVSVLPYRFGTHSGWLEACWDLGTPVVVPSCGYYADQKPVSMYVHDEHRLDEASLVTALLGARSHGRVPETYERRAAERAALARAHEELYRGLVPAELVG